MIDLRAFLESQKRFELVRGSCLEVLKRLPERSIDSFITDPPYGIELKLKWNRQRPVSIAGDGKAEARRLWTQWVPLAFDAARDDTAHAVFGTWKSAWMHEILSSHFRVIGCVAWDKRLIGLGFHLRPRWEMIYICHKGKPPRPIKAPADVWSFMRQQRPQHPCQKPIPLMRQLTALLTRPGQIVCDPFTGIASTGVAALLEGRRFLGSEIDQPFARLGRSRLRLAEQELLQRRSDDSGNHRRNH